MEIEGTFHLSLDIDVDDLVTAVIDAGEQEEVTTALINAMDEDGVEPPFLAEHVSRWSAEELAELIPAEQVMRLIAVLQKQRAEAGLEWRLTCCPFHASNGAPWESCGGHAPTAARSKCCNFHRTGGELMATCGSDFGPDGAAEIVVGLAAE